MLSKIVINTSKNLTKKSEKSFASVKRAVFDFAYKDDASDVHF